MSLNQTPDPTETHRGNASISDDVTYPSTQKEKRVIRDPDLIPTGLLGFTWLLQVYYKIL